MGMKQFHWNHLGQNGKFYKIGLLHGARTGHVLIHINGKVSRIDFKVYETKQYSFLIEEELIELNIIKHSDHYEYTMEINEEVKTPLNARRKKERKKMSLHTGVFVVLLIGAIIGGTTLLLDSKWYASKNKAGLEELKFDGKFTLAKLFTKAKLKYTYSYIVNDKIYKKDGRVSSFPVFNGDEYMVHYLPRDPMVSEVYFVRPSERQIERTRKSAIAACRNANPKLSPTSCNCQIEAVYEVAGHKGLIAMLSKNLALKPNLQFNQDTYKALINSTSYIEAIERTCTE